MGAGLEVVDEPAADGERGDQGQTGPGVKGISLSGICQCVRERDVESET